MLLDLLFPKQCISCHKYGSYLCSNCLPLITRHKQTCIACGHLSPLGKTHEECQKHTPLSGAILTTEYKDLIRAGLHKIKYRYNYDILNELLTKTLKTEKIQHCLQKEKFDFCTEVPMHRYKQNQRGFNQATLMAKWVEQTYLIKHLTLLVKTHPTTPQMQLKREERIFNVIDSFKLDPRSTSIAGKNILLIDDVTTTSSTLEECAKILKKNNAAKIWGLVLASRR